MTKTLSDYQQGVEDAMRLFDEEMTATGDVRNARQAMKTLLRFGPPKHDLKAQVEQLGAGGLLPDWPHN